MSTNIAVKPIADALARLMTARVQSEADLQAWYAAAQEFRDLVATQPIEVQRLVPHSVEHYLADADIRLRDPEYADAQQREMARVVELLSQAGVP